MRHLSCEVRIREAFEFEVLEMCICEVLEVLIRESFELLEMRISELFEVLVMRNLVA